MRVWSWLHTWSSVLCTLFLLMLCLTGLPLIFHDEIDAALNRSSWAPANPDGPRLTLDEVLAAALANRPGDVPLYLSFDTDRPVVNVTTGPTPDAPGTTMHFASFDHTSADLVPPADVGAGVMDVILQLHTDLFLGLPGMLFLGAMGALFVIAILSGVVLYVPFMRRLAFGEVRTATPRKTWLDTHNLLGMVTLAWALVVGATGVINALEDPLLDAWRERETVALLAEHERVAPVAARASLDTAVRHAQAALPAQRLQFVAFPGTAYATPAHYAIYLHGATPLTERLITPVLVHAGSGEVVGVRPLPWTLTALGVSRPLHFGDYGGLALKIVWALMTLATIVVLVSGLWLWIAKRRWRVRP
jgi:uncharacterized iron-regulated membrane protein